MAKKPVLPNIGALIGSIKPYGDSETDSGRPAHVLLQSIRLDPGQPRHLLPADLAARVHQGQLSLIQAMQVWAQAAHAPLLADAAQDAPGETVEPEGLPDAAASDERPEGTSADAGLQHVRELAASIIHVGLIHPINVIPQGDGTCLLETGERRVLAMAWLAACGLSEYERVPALFVSQSASHRARQLTENMSREDLSAVEKARGLWNSRYELSGLPSPDWNELMRRIVAPPSEDPAAGGRRGRSRRASARAPAPAPERATSLAEALEHPDLAPWAAVERQLSIGKRYRIWLTQTLELSPEAIALIERYRLPERATRPLVQRLRADPAGQVAVLRALAGEPEQEDRPGDPMGTPEAGPGSLGEAGSRKPDTGNQPLASGPAPRGPSLTADAIEEQIRQYLAGKEAAGAESQSPAAESKAASASAPVPDEARRVLATRRALQSWRRAMGPGGLNKRAIHRIAAQLSTDDEMVLLAQQFKPLVDAVAAEE